MAKSRRRAVTFGIIAFALLAFIVCQYVGWLPPLDKGWAILVGTKEPFDILSLAVQILIMAVAAYYAMETHKLRLQDKKAYHLQRKQYFDSRAPFIRLYEMLQFGDSSDEESMVFYKLSIKSVKNSGVAKDILTLVLFENGIWYDYPIICLEPDDSTCSSNELFENTEDLVMALRNHYGENAIQVFESRKHDAHGEQGFVVLFYKDLDENTFFTCRLVTKPSQDERYCNLHQEVRHMLNKETVLEPFVNKKGFPRLL